MTFDEAVQAATEAAVKARNEAHADDSEWAECWANISQAFSSLAILLEPPPTTALSFQVDSEGTMVPVSREMMDQLRRGEEIVIGPGVLEGE